MAMTAQELLYDVRVLRLGTARALRGGHCDWGNPRNAMRALQKAARAVDRSGSRALRSELATERKRISALQAAYVRHCVAGGR